MLEPRPGNLSTSRAARWLQVALLPLLAAVLLLGAAPTAYASTASEQQFLTLVNQERTGRGLPALQLQPVISDKLSRPWSAHLAATGRLAHSNVLANALVHFPTITNTGENVGYAASVPELHALLMSSPTHRANILSPTFRHVGIGVVYQDSMFWITQTFLAMKQQTAPVAAAPVASAPPAPSAAKAPPVSARVAPASKSPAKVAKVTKAPAAPAPPPASPPATAALAAPAVAGPSLEPVPAAVAAPALRPSAEEPARRLDAVQVRRSPLHRSTPAALAGLAAVVLTGAVVLYVRRAG